MRGSHAALIASVVLNVFLLGGLIGGAVWIYVHEPRPGGSLQSAVERLPQSDRTALQAALRTVRRDNRQIVLEGQQGRRDAAELLKQPTVDTVALSAALDRVRTADVALRAKLEQRIVEFATTSSAALRLLLAETLIAHLPTTVEKKSP